MLSRILRAPEFELDQADSKRLATASAEVAKFYTNKSLPPKFVAWWDLCMAIGGVYGERIAAWSLRRAHERSKQQQAQQPQPPVVIARPPPASAEAARPKPRYETVETEMGPQQVRVN